MPIVDVAEAQVHVEDTGAPSARSDAPVVLFGHGLLFSGLMFAAQVARLRERYRCVTVDWRGQGLSPVAAAGYDMDSLTADAVAVVERLDLGPVHYVGHSMGGFVGMRLAARRPDLVRSLTLLDTSAGPEDPDNVRRYRLLAHVYGALGVGPVRSRVEPIVFGPTFLADPASQEQIESWISALRASRRAGLKKAIFGVIDRDPILGELDRIAAPTLVVVGADDIATPVAKAEVIAGAISGARLEIVSDSGHSCIIEQPEALTHLIESFVDQH